MGFIASGGNNGFVGYADDVRIYNRALSDSEITALYNGNKSTGSGVYTLGSALDVNGNLNLHAGTIDPTASNYNLTVGGNAQIHGEITKRSNTFTMDGTTQTLSGSTVFHNFTKTVTAANTLYLDHSARQNFSGALTVRGAASNLLSLRSTRVGSGTNFLLSASAGTQTIDYLDVQDNDASGGAQLTCLTATEGCVNSTRNTNWSFAAAAAAAVRRKHWFWFLE